MSTKNKKNSAKKAILKKIVKSKGKKGASPLKLSNGLGNTPLIAKAVSPDTITGGSGSNLGTNGIF